MTEPEGRPDADEAGSTGAGLEEARDEDDANERVVITPGLVVLGLIAVALGVFSALVMSASSFGP
jgi:hypothetical protein